MLNLYDLSVNAVKNPSAVPVSGLRLGWKLKSDRTDVLQTSFRVTVAAADGLEYDTGVVVSKQSVGVAVDAVLAPRTDYLITVTVTDSCGETAEGTLPIVTALRPEDWSAVWIKPKKHVEGWAPYLRTKFECFDAPVVRARLWVCGLGCGEYMINGQKVSEDLIDPPMTNYEREVLYRMYDVTALLEKRNAFTALLGEGWYSQSRVWTHRGFKYGDVCLKAQLEITYADGRTQIIATAADGSWTYKYSPILLNNLYAGETYDTRFETPDYAFFDGSDEDWGEVVEDTTPRGELKICMMPPVRVIRELKPVSVKAVSGKSDGAWIIDMGENVAGFCEFHMQPSAPGSQYTFRFAETINADGTLDMRSIGSFATQCIQQDVYVARGDAQGEVWRPRFTYHAFRYVEVTGYFDLRAYGREPELSFCRGFVLSTDLEQTGTFRSANEDLNHLQRVMMSTFRSNYHGFPEDCPGREKCGWLGDAEVVCNTGMMNYDVEAAYEKYMNDIRTTTEVYGTWQMISPGKRTCGDATPLWGCAQVIIPYWMYRYYGNEAVVRNNWDLMQRWVRHELDDAKDYIITRGLGDWCPPVGHESPRRMPVEESSTLMFHEVCVRMSELCGALGLEGKAYYDDLAGKIRESFNRHYWNAELHRYGTWGTSGVALVTGIYPDGEKQNLLDALLLQMKEDDYAMPTGIYGNKYLIPALSENGHGDEALRFMFTRDHISFGTMLDDGATSLWECLEMEGIGRPRHHSTSSYNHPMHAGFAYFLYADVGGIRPLTPGFETFELAPTAYTDIPSAEITHMTPYGEIAVSFVRGENDTAYTFTVPANTTCAFRPDGKTYGSGTYTVNV